mmetsp:Transcript_3796/g.8575  ORF Transcript_3796/g.8575 Transcript_3796/m.8575 type:complete len:236 (+) Transcript_3796:473-1180(+)
MGTENLARLLPRRLVIVRVPTHSMWTHAHRPFIVLNLSTGQRLAIIHNFLREQNGRFRRENFGPYHILLGRIALLLRDSRHRSLLERQSSNGRRPFLLLRYHRSYRDKCIGLHARCRRDDSHNVLSDLRHDVECIDHALGSVLANDGGCLLGEEFAVRSADAGFHELVVAIFEAGVAYHGVGGADSFGLLHGWEDAVCYGFVVGNFVEEIGGSFPHVGHFDSVGGSFVSVGHVYD